MSAYHLDIDIPSGSDPLVEYGRDFDVQGSLQGNIEDGMVLAMELFDEDGRLVRHVRSGRKDDDRLYLGHPELVSYKEELDPGKAKLKAFGFPELLVKDPNHPEESLHDATIKCFFDDRSYKGVIVSGSDVSHGRYLDTGLDLKDENGQPYEALKQGNYLLRVSLRDRDGTVLTQAEKGLHVAKRSKAAIVRFNPVEHRRKMTWWCQENHIPINNDTLPGYLEPYLGKWYYHMGLLKYYRSNDIAVYADAKVSMFVYLCDPASTSYETELAYLGSLGRIDDPEWFKAYRYDIGEAIVGKDKAFERKGTIVPFEKELCVCRIDVADEGAEENVFVLDERHLKDSLYDPKDLKVPAGSRIAVHVICRPRQFDPKDYVLKDDNTYEIANEIGTAVYEVNGTIDERKLMMDRINEEGSIGLSLYEGYHLFELKEEDKGKTLHFRLSLKDRQGNALNGFEEFDLNVM